ncbi:BTAD domain-containing putative transcriptional regulator [Stackebrandtia nassauensis]|uniref:Transcriptional regulator, winged helix family n=1 Tax=Stackebrandtia nassauensis (strain DSM 44728 / CIP 108903 / NRRL B-16338 / NBRC 102104 / LLR-40K-21) TaxID=446470 RepID=D3PX22_STANL|nr:BTAD domain-containing putative transcriptional regulator [Stackebrandtia nassauensis]ADD45246.1 transcriptional regulator, winged helix family [Stackebrandtia nassauensis DSM 44728]
MRINLLGPFEVLDADGRTVDVGGPRVRALAARLALADGRTVSAALLIDDLWGDNPPAGASGTLHRLVSRLRSALPDTGTGHPLRSEPGGYRLEATVDARRFEDLAASGRQALADTDPATAARLLRDAERLWRGPALGGLGEAPYLTGATARLSDLRLRVSEHRFEAELALGRHAAVATEVEQLAANHPLRERLQGLLMRVRYATGRQAEALAVFERVRAELADRLGADPSPELAAVHVAVLRQDPDLAPNPPHPTPSAALTSFVGRESELDQLRSLLGRERLVTILGPGGAGKTRLARELLVQLSPDGGETRFVELSMVDGTAGLIPAILDSLGTRSPFPGGPADTDGHSRRDSGAGESITADSPTEFEALTATLHGRALLLVLDNCEHLATDVAILVERLLDTNPRLRILCTGRQPLDIAGEQRFPLPPLGLPNSDRPTTEAAAVRLFADRAAKVRPGFTVTDANAETVAEICRRLDGLPLAIELAAARTRIMTPSQLAHRLDDRFQLLTGGVRTADARHQTLRAVVEWSWDLLDEPERRLARRFSVFAGGATLAAVEAVCGGPDLPADRILDVVAALADKSLLEATDTDGPEPRFRMLDTIRAFATDQLAEAGERSGPGHAAAPDGPASPHPTEATATRTKHAHYFRQLAEHADPQLRGPDQPTALAMFQAEQPNLSSALRWALSTADTELALRLAASQVWYRLLRGSRYDTAITDDVLNLPGDDFPTERSTVATALAMAGVGFAGVDVPVAQRALTVARHHIDQADRSRHPLLSLWEPLLALHDKDLHGTRLELEKLLNPNDAWTQATASLFLGFVHNLDGDTSTARHHLEQAADHFERLGDRWGRFLTAQALAPIRSLNGDPTSAATTYREALAHLTALGTTEDVPMLLAQVGHELLRANDTNAARSELESALRLADRHGNREARIWSHCGLGDLAVATANLPEAEHHYRLAREAIAADSPTRRLIPVIESRTARLLHANGSPVAARSRLQTAITAALAADDLPSLAYAANTLAEIVLADGDPATAAEILGLAETIRGAPDQGDPNVARTTTAARTALGTADFTTAHQHGAHRTRAESLKRLTDLAEQTPASG